MKTEGMQYRLVSTHTRVTMLQDNSQTLISVTSIIFCNTGFQHLNICENSILLTIMISTDIYFHLTPFFYSNLQYIFANSIIFFILTMFLNSTTLTLIWTHINTPSPLFSHVWVKIRLNTSFKFFSQMQIDAHIYIFFCSKLTEFFYIFVDKLKDY